MLLFAGLYYFDSIVSVLGRGKDYLLQQVKPQILVTVLELIGCAVILAGSGIEFQAPTRVILYIKINTFPGTIRKPFEVERCENFC